MDILLSIIKLAGVILGIVLCTVLMVVTGPGLVAVGVASDDSVYTLAGTVMTMIYAWTVVVITNALNDKESN